MGVVKAGVAMVVGEGFGRDDGEDGRNFIAVNGLYGVFLCLRGIAL